MERRGPRCTTQRARDRDAVDMDMSIVRMEEKGQPTLCAVRCSVVCAVRVCVTVAAPRGRSLPRGRMQSSAARGAFDRRKDRWRRGLYGAANAATQRRAAATLTRTPQNQHGSSPTTHSRTQRHRHKLRGRTTEGRERDSDGTPSTPHRRDEGRRDAAARISAARAAVEGCGGRSRPSAAAAAAAGAAAAPGRAGWRCSSGGADGRRRAACRREGPRRRGR